MEYIIDAKTYLPKFLKDSALMLSIVDCLNILISNEQPAFKDIFDAYKDTIYKTRNYYNLSYEAKINIIKELGFDYILSILKLDNKQLSELLIFFNLIYCFKGKEEGLKICLDTLGIIYNYTPWDKMVPKGQRFTAKLIITGTEFMDINILKKLSNFVRSYMLPLIDISIERIIDAGGLYIFYCDVVISRYKQTKIFKTDRDTVQVSLYDDTNSNYDQIYYAVAINTEPGQVTPQEFDKVNLTITSNVDNYTVLINDVEQNNILVERGTLNKYKVIYNEQEKTGLIVCNADKIMTVKF